MDAVCGDGPQLEAEGSELIITDISQLIGDEEGISADENNRAAADYSMKITPLI